MPLPVPDLTVNPVTNANTLPLVSIIIPCYNCVEFLAEAIESALAQTHPNVEVLVIDDGSTDGSSEIIAHYPVRSFSTKHEGVSVARNRGIDESRGTYVVFLDADDRLLPHAISAGVAAMDRRPECSMAVGEHNIVSYSGDLIRYCSKPLNTRDCYARLLKSNFIECTSTVLFRREIIVLAGGFKPGLSAAEDYDLYLRIAREHPICCHSGVVAEYRLHKTNVSHKSELMLSSTLQVVYSQNAYAFTSFRCGCCYLYGLWFWRRKYGRQLTRELATNRSNRMPAPLSRWAALARNYPIGILIVLVLRVLPVKFTQAIFQSSKAVPFEASCKGEAEAEREPRPSGIGF